MAGIIGIYGLVVSVLISDGLKQELPLFTGFIQLGAGLSVGLAGLAAGFAIGIVGDAGVRGTAQQPRLCTRIPQPWNCTLLTLDSRWYDPDSHFRRSLGSVRSHRCPLDELQGRDRCHLQINASIDLRVAALSWAVTEYHGMDQMTSMQQKIPQ